MQTTKKTQNTPLKWLLILPLIIVTSVNGFTGEGIFSQPSTVQAQKITLEFYATPEITIPAGGWIRLQAPSQVSVYTTEVSCYDVINNVDCSVVSRRNSFTVTTQTELLAGEQFQFSLIGAIDNPESTMPTDSFTIISSVGETEARDIILQATPGTMNKYILTPESKVVGDSTTLQITWRGQSTLPRNGYIFLEFPKWNPQAPKPSDRLSYIQGSSVCAPLKVLASELSCNFKNERLAVQRAAPVEILPDTELSFTVTGFKNPIETGYVEGFKIWTAVRSGSTFYTVDEAVTSLTVSEYAKLNQAQLSVKDYDMPTAGMVQETNEVRLDFYLPVPLNPGCKLEVTLPAQYSVEDVKQVQSLAVFGRVQDFAERYGNLRIDPLKNSFEIRPCEAYVEKNDPATLFITNLVQPDYEKATETLKIQINTESDQFVAQIDSGVTFLPFRGPIEVFSDATTYTVQTITKVTFELQPKHVVRVEDKPVIMIEFPPEMKVASPQCIISEVEQESVNGVLQKVTPSCQRFQQTFTIKQFLAFDYIPNGERKIKFEIGEVYNPISVQKVEGLTITIYAFGQYAIDEFEGGVNWMPLPGTSLKTSIISTSLIAYENDTTYTINFTPEHLIPQNSYFEISIPTEVFIPDKSFTQSSCRALEDSAFPNPTQISCMFVENPSTNVSYVPKHNTLRIMNAFRRQQVEGGNEFSIRIPGLRNPILTTPTPSFVIASFTLQDELIDIISEGVSIAMIENAELDSVNLAIGSYVNYAKTTYTFTLVPTVPYTTQSILFITFPKQIALPQTPAELGCSSAFTNLIKSVSCSYDTKFPLEHTVRIDLGLLDNIETIEALNRFSISMNNIRNPTTTQTTDSIQIRITDSNYIDINSKLTGVTVTTSIPATVKQASVVAGTPQPGIASTFLLDFYPEHPIKSGGGLLIAYPAQTTPTEEAKLSVKITINDLEVDNSNLNLNYDLSARAVLVENIVQQNTEYIPGPQSKISIELSGLRTPFTRETTDSFSISTFNLVNNQFYYYIDKVDSGLTINSLCNYPCKTCPADEPSTCLSCYTDLQLTDGLPYNQLGTCVSECATSRFYNLETAHCDKCSSTCLDCVDRADKCTVCGIDDFLFLHQEQCLVECPAGFIEDPNENACKPCLANCLTCEDLPTSCTSCDRSSANPFLFQSSCIDQCTPNISVEVDGICTECDSTCKTCAGTPSTCTSCEPHMRFDAVKKTCSQLCESETQIFVPNPVDPTKSGSCEYCHPNCLKCAGTTETCTLCKPGFVLNLDNTCKEECQLNDANPFLLADLQSKQSFGVTDISQQGQVSIEGVCALCKEPCKTCEETTSRCTGCVDDYKLYMGSKCVMDCPEKYKEVDGVCVYEGLVCPAPRFKINKTGNGCVPQTFDCPEGYQINDARTACIPSPGSPIPFPFLLTSSLLGLLVVGSYLKEKFETKVVTNLICLVGALEGPMYLHMAILAFALDKTWILVASSIGLVFLVLTNMVFVCYYRQEIVQKDMVFQKWIHFFPKTQTWLPLITLLVNFKCSKMLYSGFFGLESTQAKFGRMKNFFFILRLSSYFSFVFVYGPIFVADFLIFADVKWGYQLFVLAIETMVIQIFIIIMTVVEFRGGAERLLNPKRSSVEFQRIKPSKNLRVMGGLDEDDDYEEGIPDMDETTLIRSRVKTEQHEISLRQKAFSQIIAQVADSQAKKGHFGEEKAAYGDLSVCLTKFDPERIKLRRAFSMEKINADQSWEAEGDSSPPRDDQSDSIQNPQRRYSFPLTPRRLNDLPETELFGRQLDDIIEANQDFLIDNCIAEVKPRQDPFQRRKVKTVSRRTQTYLRELLVVDGEEAHESDMEVIMEDAAEIDFNFAHDLVENVIHNISSDDGATQRHSRSNLKTKSVKKKKIFKAKKEIPDFELADIMGDFEIDDLGNFIIMRGENGELIDQRERLVNRRGYLVDRFGNVINMQGNIIFKAIELDIDDEIPAPFGFEKRKKNLMKLGDDAGFKVQATTHHDESSMHQTSRQMATDTDHALLNDQSQPNVLDPHNANKSQSKDHQRSQEEQINIQEGSLAKGSEENLKGQNFDDANSDDLEAEIGKITKKRVAKKKNRLRRGGKSNSKQTGLNNLPPKRIKMSDVNTYFPSVDIEQEEQRRLAKIASSISGLATQLADKQRNRYHTQGNSYFNGEEGGMQQLPLDEQESIDAIRHQTLNEIQNQHIDEEGAAGSVNETSYMMLDRPLDQLNQQSSTSANFRQSRKLKGQSRQHSAAPRPRLQTATEFGRQNRSISKGNLPINNTIAHGALRKVYGNLNDLQFAENKSQGKSSGNLGDSQSVGRKMAIPPRGQSGRPLTRARMEGLEQMYMMRLPKTRGQNTGKFPSVRRHFSGNRRSEFSPFRPLLHQFEDRPSELNIHTAFDGKNGGNGGRDILEIAENLDKMQRDYLTHHNGQMENRAVTNHELSRYTVTQGRSQMDHNERAAMTSMHQYQPNRTTNEQFDANNTAGNLTLDFQESNGAIGQAPVSTQGNQNSQLEPVQRGNWVEEQPN